jgi:hypothetical protein
MSSQLVASFPETTFPGPATVHPAWCMPNPNVDRSAPPPKKKGAKKKVTKKPAKKR